MIKLYHNCNPQIQTVVQLWSRKSLIEMKEIQMRASPLLSSYPIFSMLAEFNAEMVAITNLEMHVA